MQNSPVDQLYDLSPSIDRTDQDKLYLEKLAKQKQRGRIELIIGPMFAGKSTELLRRVKRLAISGKKCLSIKFSGDQRYSQTQISTHDQQMMNAVSCTQLASIQDKDWMDADVLGIDEGQFFEDLVNFADKAANVGKIVVISALNSDFLQQAWPSIRDLMPLAEKVKNLSAICKVCGASAAFTFKFDGKIQKQVQTDQNIAIGGSDMYMPLCRECFNEKTRQQKEMQIISQPKFTVTSTTKAACNSSSTLAESNQKSNSELKEHSTNSTGDSLEDRGEQSNKLGSQIQAAALSANLLDMNKARADLENDSDNKLDLQQPNVGNGCQFQEESVWNGQLVLRNTRKTKQECDDTLQQVNGANRVVLKDKQNQQYSNSKVFSFTGSEKEMTEQEPLRTKSKPEKSEAPITQPTFQLKQESIQKEQECL